MKTQQEPETQFTLPETYGRQLEGRVKWSKSADMVWGGGLSILTALLLWLLFGASPAGVAAPVVTAPTAGAVVAADEPIVVAGDAAPNQRLSIVGNDRPLGDVTAGADGRFDYELTGLEPGAYNIVARAVDAAGQETAISEPVTFTVTGPRMAAPVALLPEDQAPVVDLPDGGLTFDANATRTISGAGAPGATITILNGATPIAETVVDAAGRWSLELPTLDPGAYDLTLKQRLPDGQEVTLAEPLTALFAGLKAPQLVLPVEGLNFATGRPITLEGTGAPGATITVSDGAGNILGSAPVDGTGAWTLTLPAPDAGEYQWSVTQTTAEGQEVAMAESLAFTVGEPAAATTDAPTATPADAQPVVISPAPGAPQAAGQPITLEGTGAPGATITVSDAAGDPLGSTPVDESGAWTLTLPAPDAGESMWNVTQTTADGVETAPSEPLALTVVEPSGAAADAPSPATATNAQPTVTSPEAGALLPAGQPITLEGAGEPGATILVSDGEGTPLGKAIVDSAGAWTLTLPAPASGDHVWTVVQITTGAAETARPGSVALTIAPPEFVLPEVTKPAADLNAVTGATLTLEGIGQPGAAIAISEGATVLAEAAVGPTGAWQAEITKLAPGLHTLTLTQTIESGAQVEAAVPIHVTVVAKTATTSGPAASAAPAQIVRGAAPAGASVSVYAGDALLGTVTADPRGEWRLTLPAGLAFKPGELTVEAWDVSGAPLGEGKATIIFDAPLTLPVTGGRR